MFIKDQSIFKPWKEDDEATYEACARNDFKAWKLPRFVKDELDLKACEQLVIKYYEQLKACYITLMSGDNFPDVGWMAFARFCEQSKIIAVDCPSNVIDRLFIAVNFELDDMGDNPDNAL